MAEMGNEALTPRQFTVLVAVASHEGFNQTQLVEQTGIDRSTLADIVRRMLKKGLLQRRRRKEDARAYAVKLSEEGWTLLEATDPIARRVDEKILAAVPSPHRDRFLEHLAAIVVALGQIGLASKPIKD